MSKITLHDKKFVPYISVEEIDEAISNIASEINRDYKGKEILFIVTLSGAYMFASDLVKKVKVDSLVSFIKVSSYQGMSSVGEIKEIFGLDIDIENKEVIILDEIIDTGITINSLYSSLIEKRPKSLAMATLIYKSNTYKGVAEIGYKGIVMSDNKFIVGYGLDYMQKGRCLPAIYILEG